MGTRSWGDHRGGIRGTYGDFVTTNILKPAGMLHTRPDDVYAIVKNRAAGYDAKRRNAAEGVLHGSELQDARRRLALDGWRYGAIWRGAFRRVSSYSAIPRRR